MRRAEEAERKLRNTMAEPYNVVPAVSLEDEYIRSGFKSGVGRYKDIPVGTSPSHPLLRSLAETTGLPIVDMDREKRIDELIEGASAIKEGYMSGLIQRGKKAALGESQPPTLGEAESILGRGAIGRLPSQIDVPATLTQGLAPLQPTPQEIATLTSRNAEFAPLSPLASVVDPRAALSPLQTAAFEPVLKEQAKAAYATPSGPESPVGKLLADRNKYAPESPEYRALDLAVKLTTQPLDQLVTVDASGKPVVNEALVKAREGIAAAGAQKTITNIQSFTPASEEAQKDFIKSARTTYDQLKTVPSQLENIRQAKQLVAGAKGFMGPAGESLLTAAKFLNNRVGMSIDVQGIKNAEELRSRIFFNIMENLKKLDAQPSQMQQIIMMESLGNLGTDPQALPRILDAYAGLLQSRTKLYNEEVSGAEKRGVKFPYDPQIKLPMTDEEIAARLMELKSKKRGK